MTQLALTDELANTIAAKASSRGCIPQELLESIFAEMEEDQTGQMYSPSACARIQEGIDQALRGETASMDELEALLADWKHELRA